MNSAPSAVGRPPVLSDEDRKSAILKSAERIFDQMGYGDATMEEVARDCGMAKKSVYKFFPDKAALFGALIDSHDVLRERWIAPAMDGRRDPTRIERILLDLSSFILSPRQITLTRLVIAEARKSPELAERFYRECVEKTLSYLARELEPELSASKRDRDDLMLIADMFLAATLGALQLRALMLNPTEDSLRRELAERVQLAGMMMEKMLAGA